MRHTVGHGVMLLVVRHVGRLDRHGGIRRVGFGGTSGLNYPIANDSRLLMHGGGISLAREAKLSKWSSRLYPSWSLRQHYLPG